MYKFKFADIGEGLHEGIVAEIYKKEGDKVSEGDSLFSVETDKVTSDIPSPVSGIITKILMQTGDTIHVGQEIFYIDDGSSEDEKTPESKESSPTQTSSESGGASVVGEVKVSNELFDLGSFKKTSNDSDALQKQLSEKTKLVVESEKSSQETGILYNGKVDFEYDLIVIGSGPGGYLAAEEAGIKKLKTLIVEKDNWGGVCLNVGCIPTKALLSSVEVLEKINLASTYGIETKIKKASLDWTKIHARKSEVVKKLTMGVQGLMKAARVDSVIGKAKFLGALTIEVNGKIYSAKNIILATGSRDRKIDLPGFDEGYKTGLVVTSKEAINLAKKPKKLVIIGGGVIGTEFAQIFAMAGVEVTILQNQSKILANLDSDIVSVVEKKLISHGVKILTNSSVTKIDVKSKTVYFLVGEKEEKITADLVLGAVGRVPLNCQVDQFGIKLGSRNEVLVNEYQQTNIKNFYAIGDVTGQMMLAHVAYRHGVVAVKNILGKQESYSAKTVPSCIYTHPEIAQVGLSESEAKKLDKNVLVAKHSFSHVGKAIAAGEIEGFTKLIIDKTYGEILGAAIVGPHATDLISEIVVAIDLETTVYELAKAIHPHPTFSEVIWEAAKSAVHQLEK